ncbi:capping complex subunit for YIEGIA [Caldalkalibacillus mannanilyticus]|uniref:capping complex subunit for YIEGIA n=1 Tax=Caldalkalibacillus mannanilyticus TaxID=1418 RepID=UPI0005537AC0|nr:hypothetical protein [Caldalkalibacillus mannanilyticus]
MKIKEEKSILAIITTSAEKVAGGAPIFVCQSVDEIQEKAFLLENILDGMAHEVDPSLYVVVRH